jgi:ribose transport system substrate-binding protein
MTRRLLAALMVLVLVAAACGDDDDTGSTDTTAAATTAGEETTAAPETTEAPAETTEAAAETTEAAASGAGSVDPNAQVADLELSADQEAAAAASGGGLIGIVAATMATEYHANLNNSVKDRAEELGFSAEIFDSQEDPNRQLQGIEGFISAGAVAIVVTGLGGETLGPLAQDATDAGIFVVQVAGRGLQENGAVTISVEEEDIATTEGQAAADWANANLGGDAVQVAITDYPEIESLVTRADIIEDTFLAGYPAGETVGRFLGGTAENGITSMETAIQQFPDIGIVLGINDAGNLGAYQALLSAGRGPDDVAIFGIDCDPQAVSLIDEGTMYKGCVDTNPIGTGVIATNAVALFTIGETVPGIISVPVSAYTG